MEEENTKICLIDLDGTLAGYEQRLQEDLQRLASPGEPEIQIYHEDNPLWLENRIKLIKLLPGWWQNLPTLSDGFQIYQKAVKIGYKIQILTKGPKRTTNAWTEKLIWCQTHIDAEVPVTITFDKGGVYGRILVDDFPDYAQRWLKWRPRGTVIMPARHYNKGFEHNRVIRYDGTDDSWKRVCEAMQAAFDRK
jgi:5'-nucleotidase